MRENWPEKLSRLDGLRRAAMEFLWSSLPASDLDCYPFALFLSFADHALDLRRRVPWCAALDWEVFCHYVLFPRVNDEDLSFHRRLFSDALFPRLDGLSRQEDAALEVNRWCHEIACYQLTDGRTASPLTVFRCGAGRCGEESSFLVSALRSVGLAARQVYVPLWAHCDDNHAWVEVLCGGRWRFLGACEPEPVLDRGWFNAAASRAPLVHSRLFGRGDSPLHGQPLGREGAVTWYNQTGRYAPVAQRLIQVRRDGAPAPGASVCLQLLNEAAFRPIASLTADENGRVRVLLGPGTVHVLAVWETLRAEGDSDGETLTLDLSPGPDRDTGWRDFDVCAAPPVPVNTVPLDAAQRVQREEIRRRGDALRASRAGSQRPAGPVPPRWEETLRRAGGNAGAILAFLRGKNAPARERFLDTLTEKDLRDADTAVLEDHFIHLPPRPDGVPQDIYWRFIACPRVELEPLSPWRGPLLEYLHGWSGSPAGLRSRLNREIAAVRDKLYANLCWTPEKALAAGRCDERSGDLLLIAALRTMGIPARLRPLDGAPEVWGPEGFRPVSPEPSGTLVLTAGRPVVYRRDWTLSRRTPESWKTLESPENAWADNRLTAVLPAGYYRLITTARLPGGDQRAAMRDFLLQPGQRLEISLRLREFSPEEALFSQIMPPIPAVTLSGEIVTDIFRQDHGPALFLWLEEGAEPTEHLLLELTELRQFFQALPLKITVLLRSAGGAEQATLRNVLERWREIRVLLDDWAFDLEETARLLGLDPDSPPLAVLCDDQGRAVYGLSGYRVGSAALLARIAAHMADIGLL